MIGNSSILAASENQASDELRSVYDFHPHLLTQDEIKENSAKLDAFWKKAEKGDKSFINLLRTELQKPDHLSFFYFDAGRLLLHLSGTTSDKKLFLNGLRYLNIRDVTPIGYLQTVHKLAVEGFDTSDAALKILKHPNFKVFIPLHFLTLEQDYSLIFMLFPLKDTLFLDKAISALAQEKDPESQKSLMLTLWYTATEKGWEALRKVAKNDSFSHENKTFSKELLARIKHASFFSLSSYNSLKEKRRKSLWRISDEALMEFDNYTRKILSKKK